MALSAPIFFDDVVTVIHSVIFVFSLVVQALAFVHCLTQRADAFPAIGTLPKGAWLAIIGVCAGLTVLLQDPLGIFGLVGIAASAIYLLDVRAGLRDLTDGKGFW
jgi:hypothetical protein